MATGSGSVIPLEKLNGTFVVKNYQRGYRWTKEQVTNLLEDFTSFAQQENLSHDAVYFLQPIVVSRLEDSEEPPHWELIDGQQRLTTIYLMDAVLRKLLATRIYSLFDLGCDWRPDSEAFFKEMLKDFGCAELSDASCFILALRWTFLITRSNPPFDLKYESRPNSTDFLKKLAENPRGNHLSAAADNMDFYHMYQACRTIYTYFAERDKPHDSLVWRLFQKFIMNVHVLWYDTTDEVGSSPVERFSRLNMGRIPLTGAELCRALLLKFVNHDLSNDRAPSGNVPNELTSYLTQQAEQQLRIQRQTVLGSRWDDIERELRDPDFWAFLGGKVSDPRATRVDFLLDLYTNKPAEDTKEYFSFDALSQFFDHASPNYKKQDAQRVWDDITNSYQLLRFWYEDHDYYHWIGYLSDRGGSGQIQRLLQQAKKSRKSEFKEFVLSQIRKSISLNEVLPALDALQYNKGNRSIHNLLFLFNVEYARRNNHFAGCRQAGRFPFGAHRAHSWSLEHIQAQNVERLQKDEDWTVWVEHHQRVLQEMHGELLPQVADDASKLAEFAKRKDALIAGCQKFLARPKKQAAGDEFVELSEDILAFIESLRQDNAEAKHSLFNLTLLDIKQNIVLSNAIFAVKRQLLLEMRNNGEYVPIATEAIFMRRFSEEDRHLPYWSQQDQNGYEAALREVLSTFGWKTTVAEGQSHE